jgi:hypothetical protein
VSGAVHLAPISSYHLYTPYHLSQSQRTSSSTSCNAPSKACPLPFSLHFRSLFSRGAHVAFQGRFQRSYSCNTSIKSSLPNKWRTRPPVPSVHRSGRSTHRNYLPRALDCGNMSFLRLFWHGIERPVRQFAFSHHKSTVFRALGVVERRRLMYGENLGIWKALAVDVCAALWEVVWQGVLLRFIKCLDPVK